MTAYAFLETELRCPGCGDVVTDQVWFRWGYCRGRAQHPDSTYRVGDALRWRTAPDGTIPPWTYFRDERGGGNLGDPAIPAVIARDTAQFWLMDPCPRCGTPWAGGAAEIRDGVILRGWLTRKGEIPEMADILVVEPDGTLTAHPEWDDAPMDFLQP